MGYGWVNCNYWTLVCITWNYTLQITDTHRLVSSAYYRLHQAFPGNGFYRGRFFSLLHLGPRFTAAHSEFLLTDNWTDWVLGWKPFHINLLLVSTHSDFQLNWQLSCLIHHPDTSHRFTELNFWKLNSLTHQLTTSCHFTQLTCWQLNSLTHQLTTSCHFTQLTCWQLNSLTHQPAASCHFTQLTCWQLNSLTHQPAASCHFTQLTCWQLNSLTHQPAASCHFTQLTCWQLKTEDSFSPTSRFTSLHSAHLLTTELSYSYSATSCFMSLHSTDLLTTEN
jgi:hypothetical protein